MDICTSDIRDPNRHAIAAGLVIGVGARALAWARIVRAVSCRSYGGWVMFYKTFQNTITVFSRCRPFGIAGGRAVLLGLTSLGFTRARVYACIGGVV
jgi:hypothetical protein